MVSVSPLSGGGSVQRVDITSEEKHVSDTLKFAIEELGKDCQLCSWIPWTSETWAS